MRPLPAVAHQSEEDPLEEDPLEHALPAPAHFAAMLFDEGQGPEHVQLPRVLEGVHLAAWG